MDMTGRRKIDNDFALSEVIEYERQFQELLEDLSDEESPQTEKVAYLGFMRCRREDPDLTFDEYISVTTARQAQIDAFGAGQEETIEDQLNKHRAERMSRWCLATGFAPSEYKKLTYIEQDAMVRVLIERKEAENKAMEKASKRRGR
jgi:hypothetical protein